jgi:hypothetical protein
MKEPTAAERELAQKALQARPDVWPHDGTLGDGVQTERDLGGVLHPPPEEPSSTAPDVKPEHVKWRVDSAATNGRARYISYIDARISALYLDLWLGAGGWEDRYEESTLHGEQVMWCHLSLHFPDRTVVRSDVTTFKLGRGRSKDDQLATGVKGYVSDAFKRAAAKAGIGRNVYKLPELWLPVNDKGYPPPNIDELIRAELVKRGYATSEATPIPVDQTSTNDVAHPIEVDWTRWAKNTIWQELDGEGSRSRGAHPKRQHPRSTGRERVEGTRTGRDVRAERVRVRRFADDPASRNREGRGAAVLDA